MKVEYAFYTDSYGGRRISPVDWTRLEIKAEQRLNGFTRGRCSGEWSGEPWEKSAKCAVCEMAELLLTDEKTAGKTSENNDGYSVSFDTTDPIDNRLYKIARVYLGSTGLLYAGVKCRHDHECRHYAL